MENELKNNGLDLETLEKIKDGLLKEKAQIVNDLADLERKDPHDTTNVAAKFPEYGDKPDENAQEISDYSSNVVAEKVLQSTLEDIEKTLQRIEAGTYGTCKYCHKPINLKRLLARPTASSCVECKTELQQQ